MQRGRSLDEVSGMFETIMSEVNAVLSRITVAEEEIAAAQKRHGEPLPERDESGQIVGEKGPIWRSFRLLTPTHDRMNSEFVYRAHCTELLDRVAVGEDTRPATGAELVLAMMEASLAAPLTGAATGLYFRLFSRYFPDLAYSALAGIDRDVQDYERMYGSLIDDHESYLRLKLVQDWRKS